MTTEEMVALYQAGRSIYQIAAAADVHHRTVHSRLNRAGVLDPDRPRAARVTGFRKPDWSPTQKQMDERRELTLDNLRKWKLAGICNAAISRMCGCSITHIKKICQRHGIYRHGVTKDQSHGYAGEVLRPHLDKIRAMIEAGAQFKEVAAAYQVPIKRIRYFCSAHGIDKPSPGLDAMPSSTCQWAGFRTGDCKLREAWDQGEGPDFRPHNLTVRTTRVAPIRPAGVVLSRSSMAYT